MSKSTNRMPISAANPVYANVAFLRIPEFGARTVSEQASLKEELEGHTKAAIARVPTADRVVLDAGDGLAVVLFGDPGRALDIAQALHAAPAGAVQAGLNYGPLALTARGADARVFGDGLAAAAAAARFAAPGRVLVTQDFRKTLEATAPERALALGSAGDFTDTRVRLHSFFTPDAKRRRARRRLLLGYGIAGIVAILALGMGAREARRYLFPPLPAVLKFVVKPYGEIFVDGISKGRTPPLQEIEVPSGRHVVQIRNPGSPPLEVTLDLEPGERRTLAHAFARRDPPAKADFWRDLRKKFGGS